jgi:zinc finger BED domain-containing protein 5/7/8/9
VELLKRQLHMQFPECQTNFLSLHCIIHQQALCAKSAVLKNTMEDAIAIVNFIRARAINHRQFRALLHDDGSTEKEDVLYHTNVRWLSKGEVIKRIFELQDQIKEFYTSKGVECKLHDTNFCLKLGFLGDLLEHLNGLNRQLQGKNQTVCDLWRSIKVFMRKLKLLHSKFEKKLLTDHFPLLHEMVARYPEAEVNYDDFCNVFTVLAAEFERRFSDFRHQEDELRLVSEPHLLEPENVLEIYQMELLELSEDAISRHILMQQPVDLVAFWKGAVQYPHLRNHARRVLACFGST